MENDKWQELLDIMSRLRGPEGCPWDRKQTRRSLKKYIIEEAYEVLEAIDHDDSEALSEELGDLLLQVVFQAELADEAGEFNMDDVLDKITSKLVRRHPHVFGEVEVAGPEEVLHNWEMIKKNEGEGRRHLFEGIPSIMPALRRAARVQQRASTVGFDWDDIRPVIAKLREEMDELERAVLSGDSELVSLELGDILLASVNVARHAGVEAEDSLNEAIERFSRRFKYIEKALEKSGRHLGEASLKEMDALWEEAKKEESGQNRTVSE